MNKKIKKNTLEESSDLLVCFLYFLMRDHVPIGTVGELMREVNNMRSNEFINKAYFSNGWLAKYAKFVAKDLKKKLK
tara:strand:- start:54 stop:284 length:231 start_codon:yes stop_codon:yes gene_type:complete